MQFQRTVESESLIGVGTQENEKRGSVRRKNSLTFKRFAKLGDCYRGMWTSCLLLRWHTHGSVFKLLLLCLQWFSWWSYPVFSSVQSLSRVQLFVIPWITARQASLSIIISQSSLRLTSIKSTINIRFPQTMSTKRWRARIKNKLLQKNFWILLW